jgi:uncharacterized protein (TIGR00645 family)
VRAGKAADTIRSTTPPPPRPKTRRDPAEPVLFTLAETEERIMKRLEHGLELLIFNSRWLLAPIYVGLVLSVLLLLVKFVQEFVHILARMFTSSEGDVILAVLTLVDLSLVANLLLIVIFSGYENFVSKIHTEAHEDRPEWMGKVDFSGLKLKLVASIVAISGIELLKAFVNTGGYSNTDLAWKVGIHGMLVVSGVLLALMDRIAASAKH